MLSLGLSLMRGSAAFTPARLFANDEPGIWLEADDASTLFTDTAGTTPVSEPGDAVAAVREKANNLLITQATTAARPLYALHPVGGVRNVVTYSEQFDNAAWNKSNVSITTNAATSPDGELTADRIVPSGSSNKYANGVPNFSALAGQPVCYSCYLKADGYSKAALRESSTTGAYASFDFEAGSVIETGNAGSIVVSNATIVSVGDGWYRASMTCTNSGGTQSNGFGLWFLPNNYTGGSPTTGWTSDGTSGVFAWGAQLEQSATATAYQRVKSFLDVSEAGKARRGRLWFNGTSHFMQTPTITPGTDKVQVFAGVRKLSDAATATFIEMSEAVVSNAGSFAMFAPSVASANYMWRSRGSEPQVDASYTNAAIAAPVSNILTALGDISGDLATLRIDGTQVAQSTADQGTGNYLAYSLYIGARGGASVFFNGYLDSLVNRFGPTPETTTIAKTEAYAASKTPESTI